MGLDQYAYAAMKAGARDEFYEAEYNEDESKKGTVPEPHKIAYWPKHPNLHGWMERLWLKKLGVPITAADQAIEGKFPPCVFNGIELELTWQDIDMLEKDIKRGKVASLGTMGFFFGNPIDDYYREHDLKFCVDAKAEIFLGFKVFYNSSW